MHTNVALSQGLLSCYSASPTGDWVVAFFTVREAGVSSRGSMLCKSRVSACGIRRLPLEGKFNDFQGAERPGYRLGYEQRRYVAVQAIFG